MGGFFLNRYGRELAGHWWRRSAVVLIYFLSILCLAAEIAFAQELVLTSSGSTTVHEGELIRLRLEFRDGSVKPAQTPPAEIWGFNGFRVEPPPPECRNYNPSCSPMDMWTFHKSDPILNFGRGTAPVETDLNSRVAALKPGRYLVRATMSKQVLRGHGPMEASYGYAEPKQELVSKPVPIEVVPATTAWVRSTIDEVRRVVDGPGDYEARQRAARQLGFLYWTEAFEAGLDLYAKTGQRDFLFGLYRNPNEAQSCEMLRSGVQRPGQKISGDYLWLMANVCRRAKFPFPDEIRNAGESDPRRTEWFRKTAAYEQEVKLEAIKILASPSAGTGQDAVAERAEVLRYVSSRLTEHDEPVPDFAKPAIEATVRDLASYSPQAVISTLSEFWYLLRKLNVRPAIEALLRKDPQDFQWIEARQFALRALVQIDPAGGRSALLAELREFRPTLDESLTELLPASAVPAMDDALIDHLAEMQHGAIQHPTADPFLLIARYLSVGSQERMKRIYESQTDPCQAGMVAYFLRVQPAYAEQMLKRFPLNMHAPPGPCTNRYINGIPRLIMTAPIENFLVAHLQHENVSVKADAARLLSGFGSAAAKKALWDSFLYFHEYWKDRVAELNNPDYRDGRFLEEMLRNCVARGRGWFTDEAELRRLGALCLSEQCQRENRNDLQYWEQKPIPIEISFYFSSMQARVAQYWALESVELVKAKLAQFPGGTRFQLRVSGAMPLAERQDISTDIRRFCSSKGLVVN